VRTESRRSASNDLEKGVMLLPEANPRMTIAISQQKRIKSPNIIFRKERGGRRLELFFLHCL
jgi:hypothetical protein